MSHNCFDRCPWLWRMMRRNLVIVLVLALFATILCNPAIVKAENSTMTITGYVSDEFGQPVNGNNVFLEFLDSGNVTERIRTQTSANGSYSFQPIFIGPDYLIKQFRLVVSNPGVTGLTSQWTDNYKYGTYPYNFTITRYGTTVIHMLEETGAPVPAGVPMWFSYTSPSDNSSWPWNAPGDGVTPHHTTGSGGNISLLLSASWGFDGIIGSTASSLGGFKYGYPAGKKEVGGIDQTYNMVDGNGVNHTSELRYELPSDLSQHRVEMMDVSSQAGKTRELDFYVRALGKVIATAREAVTTAPVLNVNWCYSSISGFIKYAVYGTNGSEFSIYGYGEDTISIISRDPSNPVSGYFGHKEATGSAVVTPWGVETVTLNMEPNSPGTISGKVVNPSGNGISGATVELLWPLNSEESDAYQPLKSVNTDNTGNYLFTNVVPTNEHGKYVIQATKAGFSKATSNEIVLDSGQQKTIENLIISQDSQPPYWGESDSLNTESIGWSGVVLQWRKAMDNTGVMGYRIYNGDTLLANSGYEEYYNSVHYTVNNLQPNTNYSFNVKAYDEAGNVSAPLPVTVTTLPAFDPSSKVIRASLSSEGLAAIDDSLKPAISADGRFIAFESEADNLYNGDTNDREDIFIFDRNTGLTKCVSLTANDITGNGRSQSPAISADGQYVAFASTASDLVTDDTNGNTDIYLYEVATESIKMISIGQNNQMSNGYSDSPSISSDGRYIAFTSSASNLVEGDSNGKQDIFVKDRTNGTITRLSFQSSGDQITWNASNPVISANGLFAAYEVYANYINTIYVYDIANQTTGLVTRKYNDALTACSGFNSSISADGRYIAFYSSDNGLIENDNNGKEDIFIYDRVNDVIQLISKSSAGSQGNNYSTYPAISADGKFVAFKSMASNFANDDTTGYYDVFVRDLVRGTTERVSVNASGAAGNGDSSWKECSPAISADGRYVAYDSIASNLVTGDSNSSIDIFIYDRGIVEGPDTTAPILSNPGSSAINTTTAALNFTTNEAGTYYCLVYAAADIAPSVAAIKSQGEAITKGTGAVSIGVKAINITSLTLSTAYKGYIIVEDAVGNVSSILEINFTTTAETPIPTIALITSVSNVQIAYGTSGQNAIAALPASTTIKDSADSTHTVNLNWIITGYNGNAAGNYMATGTFTLPAGVNQTTPVTALVVTSTVTVSSPTLSGNADLSSLALSSGTLNPTFSSSVISYSASVANSVTSITVTPSTADNNGTVKVNGQGVTSGHTSQAISLSEGSNAITIEVTAQNGTKKTYVATVSRATSGGDYSGPTGSLSPNAIMVKAILTAGTEKTNLNVSVDSTNGSTTATLSGSVLNSAFQGVRPGSDGVRTVKVEMPEVLGTNSYVLELPSEALASVNMDRKIEMKSKAGTISLQGNMFEGTGIENTGNIGISIGNADKSMLPQEVWDRIGGKPILELKLIAGNRVIDWNNPNAPVMVSIPYTPTAEELADPEHITIWCVDGRGNVIEVPSGRYDPVTGTVSFSTTQFSNYAVAYVRKTFEDLSSVPWAKKQIDILTSKGIVRGVSEKEYAPNTNITRADFLYFLIKTLDVDAKFDENFGDIRSDAYYYKEIAIAKKLGITAGIGNNKFSPDTTITRQDMMVLTMRALRMLKKLELLGKASDLNIFTDKSLISEYAVDGVASIVKEGLIVGSGNKINPLGNTTRAEAAVFVYRIYNKY